MADISTKLPDMTDDELKTLNANAQRLEQSGTVSQKASAVALLPLVSAEIAARTTVKLAQARENAALRKVPAKSRKSAKSAAAT